MIDAWCWLCSIPPLLEVSALSFFDAHGKILFARLFSPVLVAVVVLVAYHNIFSAPFLFDDSSSIVENETIRRLWPPALTFPKDLRGATVDGRPVVNFTLAINYAIGALDVRGYRAANVLIHLTAAFALFALLRRTFRARSLPARYRSAAWRLALAITLLWASHPLLTQAVSYVVQRAESLMALFFLLTLYCFARSADSAWGNFWKCASVLTCFLGMGTKEVMVVCPVVVFIYDRAFFSRGAAEALRRRKWYYLALASSWLLLAFFISTTDMRGESVGAGLPVRWWEYLGLEVWAVARYLKLSLWPTDLVFDYGRMTWILDWSRLALPGLLVATFLAVTTYALVRKPAVGFAPTVFFCVLAPTSSFVPILDPVVEHRMYLPLAALCAMLGIAVFELAERFKSRRVFPADRISFVTTALLILSVVLLASTTIARNRDYLSVESIWGDSLRKVPENYRAALHIGIAAEAQGDLQKAVGWYKEAIDLKSDEADSHYNLGVVLLRMDRSEGAAAQFETTLELKPRFSKARFNLGLALMRLGKFREAAEHFRHILLFEPEVQKIEYNLGKALLSSGNVKEGIFYLEMAVGKGDAPLPAVEMLADALAGAGRFPEAAQNYDYVRRAATEAGDLELASRMEGVIARLGK